MRKPLSKQPTRTGDALLDLIGHTPLFHLAKIGAAFPHVELLGKAEWFNPGGSVKDRAALSMILAAEKSGDLTPGKIILDATSGNTGIAYAMIGARKGYKVKLCLPANASQERKRTLRAYGADLVLTDPTQGSDGAILDAKRLYRENPGLYFYPDQYNNAANPQAHYTTTGPEIIEQTAGRVTHFVAGLGTSGTLMGAGRRLREFSPKIKIVAVQPDSPFHGLEGLKHMETAMVPGIFDPKFPDETVEIGTEESQEMTKRVAREEGLLVGISSGAALVAALTIAARIQRGVIVTILCDGGSRYLSEHFWDK